ncbi:MAG: rhodanese-like domain-containing protein [Clostridium sp.]|nr:rhodanese-like domain-containing protein [Clostridium sp.]MCM1444521.1 rhodanese-like domain-containing protein [Candidatus Amulumruptor caecigallinarius]
MFSIISLKDFENQRGNFEIVDIRSIEKYNNNHIYDSINIPMEKLISTPEKYLNKNKLYCIYCTRGVSSLKVGKILSKLGYRILSLDGGYEAWLLNK